MKPFISYLVVAVHIFGVLSTFNCPLNETKWKTRSKTKVCQGYDVYHCLLVEDEKTRKEICIETRLIMNGHCPILTYDDNLHWKTCNATGCPGLPFRSDEVYKYPVCFGDIQSEEKKMDGNESEDNASPLSIGIPLGFVVVVLVITAITCKILKRRRQTPNGPPRFPRDEADDCELGKLIKNPADITTGIHQLESSNILYVIGQLGNSVSTTGKEIADEYANRYKMSCEYYNYLEFSEKFSNPCHEKDFQLNCVNFIDGWGGLWNENPCERQDTLDTIKKVVEQRETLEKKKFIIGIRTETKEKFNNDFKRLGIHMREGERLLLDSSSADKRKSLKKEIKLLQNSCSNRHCSCKTLNLQNVFGIHQVPIGTYLVVQLMGLDHTMIPDFILTEVGPLKAVRNHFERLMEGDNIWSWLPYFVCLGYYDKEEFRQEIADKFNISKAMFSRYESVEKYIKRIKKHKLAPMWSTRLSCDSHVENQYNNLRYVSVFRHNFLYICAFHACFKKYPQKIMLFCNLDAILQLVRPKGHHDDFTIEADNTEVDFFCEERLKNLAKDDVLSEHPLIQDWKNRKRIKS